MSSSKRADLQGIRGLAILAVLLFHFFPAYFPNGYIGVDQFFVLSGFLISMILRRSQDPLKEIHIFYYRRIKRIIPMYLFVMTIVLVSLFVIFPRSNIAVNIESAWYSILFYKNMAETSEIDKYEIALKLAEDAFTHTWSLAVEMQFYLLIPFIFLVGKDRVWKMLSVVSALSLGYYLSTDKNTSFNSVFARLWQFSCGSLINLICEQQESGSRGEATALLKDEMATVEPHSDEDDMTQLMNNLSKVDLKWLLSNLILLLSVLPQFYSVEVPQNLLRITATLTTASLILSGSDVPLWLLNQRPLTYLGDISYSLYLVHWPIFTYVKLEYHDSTTAIFVGFVSSIAIAIVLTETYEKFYLRLNVTGVAILLVILYSINIGIIYNQEAIKKMTTPRSETAQVENIIQSRNYKNVSKETVIKLNSFFMNHGMDDHDFWFKECVDHPGKLTDKALHGCDYTNLRNRSGMSSVIVGNSYAENIAGTLNEECRDTLSSMQLYWYQSCDILVSRDIGAVECLSFAADYLSTLKRLRPDILYILTRHVALMEPLSNEKVTMDSMFLEAQQRLEVYQQYVRKRIYILDATPCPALVGPKMIMKGLETGNMPTQESLEYPLSWTSARQRIQALVKTCKKCRSLDFLPTFMKGGKFQMYDSENGLLYYDPGAHMTPRSLAMVRPKLHATCHSLH